jgi:hypothetical protein
MGMLWLADFIDQPPSKVVREIYEQIRQDSPEARSPLGLELRLDVGGWPSYRVLRFVSADLILDGESRTNLRYAEEVARNFYLSLRGAAAFALRVRRLAETYGMYVNQAIRAWACWEYGYSSLEEVSEYDDHMDNEIRSRIEELNKIYSAGWHVLQAQESKQAQEDKQSATGIRVSSYILRTIPRPPEETGIRWVEWEPLWQLRDEPWNDEIESLRAVFFDGQRVVVPRYWPVSTHLAAWLGIHPWVVFQTIKKVVAEKAAKASSKRDKFACVLLLDVPVKTGSSASALLFDAKGVRLLDVEDGELDPWYTEFGEEALIKMIAEERLRLCRAAAYAAWVESGVEMLKIGADELIRLDALSAYGFEREEDVPEEVWDDIKSRQSELSELHKVGLFVLSLRKALVEERR